MASSSATRTEQEPIHIFHGATTQRAIGAGLVLALTLICLTWSPAAAQRVRQYGIELNTPTVSGQYLAVSDKTGLEGATGAYTIEAWVWPHSYAGYPCIVGNDYTQSFWVGLNASGHVRFYPRGGYGQFVESTGVIPLDQWTHVSVTYESSSGWAIYVNGVLDQSGSSITGLPGTSADSLCIGADRVGGTPGTFWIGKLDEIRMWNRALSGTEIAENQFAGIGYGNHLGARYAGLAAAWYSNLIDGGGGSLWLADMAQSAVAGGFDHRAQVDADAGEPFDITDRVPLPVDFNQGVEMNGVDDYASTQAHSDGYDGGLTIEAWICPYSNGGYQTIVGREYTSSFWLGLKPGGQLRFYPIGGFGEYVDGVASVPLDKWTHVAASFDPVDKVVRLYINGELDLAAGFSGAVGENGREIYVGADNEAVGPAFLFNGILDEVCVTNGPISGTDIAARRFLGTDPYIAHDDVVDLNGVSRTTYRAHFGPYTNDFVPQTRIYGSHARMVLSGAPMFNGAVLGFSGVSFPMDEFLMSPPGGTGLTVPDQLDLTSLSVPIAETGTGSVTDVDVFVSLSSEDLATTSVELMSPTGTNVTLMAPGDLIGRSLQTVFDDASSYTFGLDGAPCNLGVQPSTPLSAFNGESATGTWTVSVQTTGGAHFAVWAVGVRIGFGTTDVAHAGDAGAVQLTNAGAEPVRGQGAVQFSLPRDAKIGLTLYDPAGRAVRRLASGLRAAGEYRVAWNAAGLAPGRYLLSLDVEGGPRRTLPVTVLH